MFPLSWSGVLRPSKGCWSPVWWSSPAAALVFSLLPPSGGRFHHRPAVVIALFFLRRGAAPPEACWASGLVSSSAYILVCGVNILLFLLGRGQRLLRWGLSSSAVRVCVPPRSARWYRHTGRFVRYKGWSRDSLRCRVLLLSLCACCALGLLLSLS